MYIPIDRDDPHREVETHRIFAGKMPYVIPATVAAYIISHGDMRETLIGGAIATLISIFIAWLAKQWWEARKKRKQEAPKGPKKLLAEKMEQAAVNARRVKARARETEEIQYRLFLEKLGWTIGEGLTVLLNDVISSGLTERHKKKLARRIKKLSDSAR